MGQCKRLVARHFSAMGDLIEAKKRELEQLEIERRKIALLRSVLAHAIGIFTAMVELYLGYKVDFKDRR